MSDSLPELTRRLRKLRLTPAQLKRRRKQAEKRVKPFVGHSYTPPRFPTWVKW